jgi:hypothetical protein
MKNETPLWMWAEEGNLMSQPAPASQATERAKVRELKSGDKVRMYSTVVQILAPWFVPDNEKIESGWGRLPMRWDGLECAPCEKGDTEVEVVSGERDS